MPDLERRSSEPRAVRWELSPPRQPTDPRSPAVQDPPDGPIRDPIEPPNSDPEPPIRDPEPPPDSDPPVREPGDIERA